MKVPSWVKLSAVAFTSLLFGGGRLLRLSFGRGFGLLTSLTISLFVGLISGFLCHFIFELILGNVAIPKKMRPYGFFHKFWDTVFRLFPHPEVLGLYPIGEPDDTSPIITTGNFRLTVNRVQKALNFDCWLLICNSRGINIWCSSLASHFGTNDVINAILNTNLSEATKSRRMILPQLCAANVFCDEIYKKTGFHAEFGPVYAENLAVYLENPENEEIRNVKFTAAQRVEMAIGSPIILSIVLLALYNFLGLAHLLYIIPLLYLLSIIHGLVFPYRFIRNTNLWAVFCGLVVFLAAFWLLPILSALIVGIGMAYLVSEFTGWSPLNKYSIFKKPDFVSVDLDKCIGCSICQQVCPRNVFEIREKAIPVRNQHCVICLSCIRQCPNKAIEKVSKN